MNRKAYIILLLIASWVLYNVHRIWNNTEPVYTKPFPFDRDYPVTWHWYIYMILRDLSHISVLSALWLYVDRGYKRDASIIRTFTVIFLIQIIEVPHYLLSARHTEWVLALEGVALIWVGYKLIRKK